MSKIYMFHMVNNTYEYVDEGRQAALEESGYQKVDKSDLLAIYNPSTGKHMSVLRSDAKNWINRGFYAEPTVVYHPEQGAKTVSAEEAGVLMKDGWYDSPAKFPAATTEAIVERAVKNLKKGE